MVWLVNVENCSVNVTCENCNWRGLYGKEK